MELWRWLSELYMWAVGPTDGMIEMGLTQVYRGLGSNLIYTSVDLLAFSMNLAIQNLKKKSVGYMRIECQLILELRYKYIIMTNNKWMEPNSTSNLSLFSLLQKIKI